MAHPVDTVRVPLQPTRLIPSPFSSPVKRVDFQGGSPTKKSQKAQVTAPKRKIMSVHPSPPKLVVTSSPISNRGSFPSVPHIRLMTPSSSTIAASSSPGRRGDGAGGMMSSSPMASKVFKSAGGKPVRVEVSHDRSIILGRHRNRLAAPLTGPTPSSVPLTSTIPAHIDLLQYPNREADIVALPRGASHASRVHAIVEFNGEADTLRIAVIGQNGVRVKSSDRRKSQRVKRGEVLDIKRGTVQVDFYGCLVDLFFPSVQSSDALPIQEIEEEADKTVTMDIPPSSPPMELDLNLEEEVEEEGEDEMDVDLTMDVNAPAEEDVPDDASSGLSAAEEEEQDEKDVKEEILDQALKSSPPLPARVDTGAPVVLSSPVIDSTTAKAKSVSRDATPEALPLPEGIDLAAILASTVVFSGSSKMSLPDMVKHMLESQPSLKDHGDEVRWTLWVKDELEGNEMFGKVERHGKDASGRPLLPHFFYNPEHDPDASRARELSGLVRPLRAAQRGGGKAIDWRPFGSGRRRY